MSAITSLSLAAVHKAIEYGLIRSRRVREGRVVHRMLSKSQAVYLRLEAKGLRSLPLASRRQVAQAVEQDPGIDVMALSEGSVILIQFKSARQEVATGLRRLPQAVRMVESDTAIMHGAPVYKGTRIPVESIADMLLQGATVAEILDGYPPLSREKVELAPMYCRAFPRRGRPAIRRWANRTARRVSEHSSS